VSELRKHLTLWFLRRFAAFRELERRLDLLSLSRLDSLHNTPRGSLARLEVEVLHTLLTEVPCHIHVDILPTQQVSWLGPGELRVQMFEGGGDHG
jgi:hypothetical protein